MNLNVLLNRFRKGDIAESRYKNYLKMLVEEEEHFRTNDY